jgi:NAD dependent epimerase/dehydratase family enzyme
MRLTLTGATGRLGSLLVGGLQDRGDEVTMLSRDPAKGVPYDPMNAPAPPEALACRDAIVHLAGEDIAQRWNGETLKRIKDSREIGNNKEFSKALGRALHRPAIAPVPGFAIRLLYGGMAKLVIDGRYARPRRTLDLGYEFRHPDLDEALRSALEA